MATRSADKTNDLLESMYNNNPQTRMFSRLADSFRKKGNIGKAVEICLNGLQNHPSYVTGRIILGRCYLEQENLPKAIEEFKTVCFLDRRNLIAIKMLADIFARQGMQQKAGDLYNVLIKMDPFNKSVQKLSSQFKNSNKSDLFEILALTEPTPEAWNFTSVPLQDEALFHDDTGAFSPNDSMELLSSVPYQEEMQTSFSGSIEDTINNIQGTSNSDLNGDDISEHLSSIFDEDSPDSGDQQEQIPLSQAGISENQNYPESGNVSGEDVTERMDLLFGQTPENAHNHDDQELDLISSADQNDLVQNGQHDVSSIFSETIQFDRSFLDNATTAIPENLIQDTTENYGPADTGADQYTQQDLISENNVPDFSGYSTTESPDLVDFSDENESELLSGQNPDLPGQYDLIDSSEPDQQTSEALDIDNQQAFAGSSDTEQTHNSYLDLNIFDHSEFSNDQGNAMLVSNDEPMEPLTLPDQPTGVEELTNNFTIPDISESDNTFGSLQNNNDDDIFISAADSSDSLQPEMSEDNEFTSLRNIIAGEEQSEDSTLSENLSFDFNVSEEAQSGSVPLQTADPDDSVETSEDIFNTSPMDLLLRRNEEADDLLPQINESEDSLEVKTSVFNSEIPDDFEFLDNNMGNIEQPSILESDVESHTTEHTGSTDDIFEGDADSLIISSIDPSSDDSESFMTDDETSSHATVKDAEDSEFVDFMKSVQTPDTTENTFDFASIEDSSPEDNLLEINTIPDLPEDAFEPQNAGNTDDNDLILSDFSSQELNTSEESIITDVPFSATETGSSMDSERLPGDNTFSAEDSPGVTSPSPEFNIDSMILSEEITGSSENEPNFTTIEDSINNDIQTDNSQGYVQPLTTESGSEDLSESMYESEQAESGVDIIQQYDNTGYQQSVTEKSEDSRMFDSQPDPLNQQLDMSGIISDEFTDKPPEGIDSAASLASAEEDVQVEYDEDVISEMDVLVTDSPLGIVSGDDVAEKLDQIFTKNGSDSIKEQSEGPSINAEVIRNNFDQPDIYNTNDDAEDNIQEYGNTQKDPAVISMDNELPSFESYADASSQFTSEDSGTDTAMTPGFPEQQFTGNIEEPEISTEIIGHTPEINPVSNASSFSNVPVITAEDLEERLEEFFPDENLTEDRQGTDFVDEEDTADNSEAGGFYTIYGDDAVNTGPLDDLHGIDEVEITNAIEPGTLQDEGGSFYQEWNDACNSDEQLTTETIAITPPKNFSGSEGTDAFAKTTMTDEDDLNAKPYSIPDHVLTPTLADIYYQQGQYDLAIQIYSRLLEKDPENDTIKIRLQSIQESFEQSSSSTRSPLHTQSEKTDSPVKKRKTTADNRPLAGVRLKKKPRRSTNT